MRIIICLFFSFVLKTSVAQSLSFESFRQSLHAFGIETDEPTEGRAEFNEAQKESILNHDFRINLKKENIEIWVDFKAFDSLNISTQMPNVFCKTAAVNAGINEEAAITTVLKLSDEYLKDAFGADWGRELYFRPKKQLSNRGHCRLLSLYKERIGHLNIFYFFDEKSDGLDAFYEMFRFKKQTLLRSN